MELDRRIFLAAILLVGGCQTASLGDIAPTSSSTSTAPTSVPVQTAQVNGPSAELASGPVDTATYPNLNVIPDAEAPQLTDAERNAGIGELTAARQRQVASGPRTPASDVERLRRLGQSHGDAALKEIGAE